MGGTEHKRVHAMRLTLLTCLLFLRITAPAHSCHAEDRGQVPIIRSDLWLTSRQTLPGAMRKAPSILARYRTPKTKAALVLANVNGDGETGIVLAFRAGDLRAYTSAGKILWQAEVPGVSFYGLLDSTDIDGDGTTELVLQCGTPGSFAAAAVVLEARTGRLLCKIPFAAGCFRWHLKVGGFVPELRGKQLLLVNSMQVEPTKAERGGKGMIALWSFEEGADKPQQRWSYEPEGFQIEYPALFLEDLNQDGRIEAFVTGWCYLYYMNLSTGRPIQHFGWEPQGANKRHYGWNQLVDFNDDGWLDYFVVAGTKHVDHLRNNKGMFELAWTRGWPDSITSEKYSMVHAPWPAADVDGDGRKEAIFSIFNEEDSGQYRMYILDGDDGSPRAMFEDLIPRSIVDLDGDGAQEILATRHDKIDRKTWHAVELVVWDGEQFDRQEIESATGFVMRPPEVSSTVYLNFGGAYIPEQVVSEKLATGASRAWLRFGDKTKAITLDKNRVLTAEDRPIPKGPPPANDFSNIPADGGTTPAAVLAADLDGNGACEIILSGNPAKVLALREGLLIEKEPLPAICTPVIWDLDGDGRQELLVGDRVDDNRLRATSMDADTREVHWEYVIPKTHMSGQYGSPMYLTVGRFTGGDSYDVYAYANKPGTRAMVLRGDDGSVVWEKTEVLPGTQEFYGPFVGKCSVFDFDDDGADDLIFASPTYLTCISGRDGAVLCNPRATGIILATSWVGYASAVLCPQPRGRPVIQLIGAWSATGALPMGNGPDWPDALWSVYQDAPEWRTGSEVVFRDEQRPGHWCVVWPDNLGILHCREVETGKERWRWKLGGLTPSPAIADVDGDGRDEIVVSGGDGKVIVLRDAKDRPEVVWETSLGMPAGGSIVADVNGDGKSEIVVGAADGVLYVLGASNGKK